MGAEMAIADCIRSSPVLKRSAICSPSASKLATARLLDDETANCSLGAVLGLGLGAVDERALYDALDWLLGQQARIEGRSCPLARLGHNRDGKSGKLPSTSAVFTSHPNSFRPRSTRR
jgi:hypothetical protein